jgi:hypothetical protein
MYSSLAIKSSYRRDNHRTGDYHPGREFNALLDLSETSEGIRLALDVERSRSEAGKSLSRNSYLRTRLLNLDVRPLARSRNLGWTA